MSGNGFVFTRRMYCYNRRKGKCHLEASYYPFERASAEIIVEVFFLDVASDKNSLACDGHFVDIRVCHDVTQDIELNHTCERAESFIHAYQNAVAVAKQVKAMALGGRSFDDVVDFFSANNALIEDNPMLINAGLIDWTTDESDDMG